MSKPNKLSKTSQQSPQSEEVISKHQHWIDICTKRLSKSPNNKKALLLRGSTYLKMSWFNESKEDLEKLIIDPILNSTAYFLLGCWYEKQCKFEESKDNLTRALELDPNNINALFLRGAILNSLGYFQEAIDDYYLALEKDSIINMKKNIYRNIDKLQAMEEENPQKKIDKILNDLSISRVNNSILSGFSRNDSKIDIEINNHIREQFKEFMKMKAMKIFDNWGNHNNANTQCPVKPMMINNTTPPSSNAIGTFPNFQMTSIKSNKLQNNHNDDHNNFINNSIKTTTNTNTGTSQSVKWTNKTDNFNSTNLFTEYQMDKDEENSNWDYERRNISDQDEVVNYLGKFLRSSKKKVSKFDKAVNHSVDLTPYLKCDEPGAWTTSQKISKVKEEKSNRLQIQNEWEIYHDQGLTARKKGDYKLSIDLYTKSIELNSSYFKGYFNRAFAYDKLGCYQKAINDYTKAIEIYPNYAFTFYNRGITYEKLSMYKNSIKDFTKAIELNNQRSEFFYNRAYIFKKQSLFHEAINDYSTVIKHKPSFAAFLNRGICYEKLGKYTEAINDMNKCIWINKNSITSYCHIASIYSMKLNNYEKAIEYYNKLILINPNYSPAFHNLGIIHDKMNKHSEALEYFTKALSINNNNPIYYYNRSCVYNSVKNYAKGIEDISRAISLDTDNLVFYELRAFLFKESNDYTKAIEDYGYILRTSASKHQIIEALFKRGMWWELKNEYHNAISDYNSIIREEPWNANAFLKRGWCYERWNQMELSLKDYERSWEIDKMLSHSLQS